MKFEVGKYYQHNDGSVMHILSSVNNCTGYFNPCLVGEEPGSANFLPIGTDKTSAENWKEIPAYKYYQAWLKGNEGDAKLQQLATPPKSG